MPVRRPISAGMSPSFVCDAAADPEYYRTYRGLRSKPFISIHKSKTETSVQGDSQR